MKAQAIVFVDLDGEVVPAGRLRIHEDGRYSNSVFEYGLRYLERKNAIALDPVQLPLTSEKFETGEDFVLFNGLRDAAPDAWGRKLIDIYMIRSANRAALEQDYLLTSQSGTRQGAIQFGKTTDGPSQVLGHSIPDLPAHLGDLYDLIQLADAVKNKSTIPDRLSPFIGSSTDMGGARPKATVDIDGFPWIAKFSMPHDRFDMPSAEAACLELCSLAGIATPRFRIETIGGRRTFLIERFDREMSEAGLRRIPMISSLSLLGAHERDVKLSGYADIYDGIRRFGRMADASAGLFRRMVMNVLCGNTDDHYRNHAFLSRNGAWELSPVYDVTPTLQVGSTRSLFFHLGKAGSGREARLSNAVRGAESLGLDRDQACSIANELSCMVDVNWRPIMLKYGASLSDISLIEDSFSEAGKLVSPDDIDDDLGPSMDYR